MTSADRTQWIDRLLARRPDAALGELEAGRPAVYRRDELLVATRDSADVESRGRQWIDGVENDADAMLTRVRLRPGRGVRPAELAAELARDGRHHRRRAVTPNHLMSGAPGAWGGGPAEPAIPATSRPTLPATPSGAARDVTVAILDTGISRHPWFVDQPWFADVRDQDLELLDELPQDDLLDAQAGHGTFIAGIVLQLAPSAHLLTPKLLASDGVCDEFSVVRKLRRLRRWSRTTGRQVDVVNLSFGGYTSDDQPSPLVADAVAGLGRDTVVVACAGNDDDARPFWPAALKPVIAVGALDSDGSDRAPFSNYGWWVDACAVGERVTSSFVEFDGPAPSTGDFDGDRFHGYAQWSGTSFAAPAVAGAIAATALARDIPASLAADVVLDPDVTAAMPDLGVVVGRRGTGGTR